MKEHLFFYNLFLFYSDHSYLLFICFDRVSCPGWPWTLWSIGEPSRTTYLPNYIPSAGIRGLWGLCHYTMVYGADAPTWGPVHTRQTLPTELHQNSRQFSNMGKTGLKMTWWASPIFLLFIPLLLEGTIKRLLAGLISACMQRECIYTKKTKSPVWDTEIIKSSSKKGLEEAAWEGSWESWHLVWGQPGCQCGCCSSKEALPVNQLGTQRLHLPSHPAGKQDWTTYSTRTHTTTRGGQRITTNK